MRRLLLWLLTLAVLCAQSAWAFEGHAGHFEGYGHHQAPAQDQAAGDQGGPAAATHCAHSPVHFMAVHREAVALVLTPGTSELPLYRGPSTSLHAEPPTQPPRG